MADPRWAQYYDRCEDVDVDGDIFRVYLAGTEGPVVVLLHGGGHTGLTWALTTKLLKQHCRVVAPDFRGHGESHTRNDSDLSEATLVADTIHVLQRLLPSEHPDATERGSPLVLVGHSMGGAIAIRVASSAQLKTLVGMVVIDVVEGTALAALSHMQAVLANRPESFASHDEAIQWSLQTGAVRNAESARVSIPSQVVGAGDRFVWRTDLRASAPYWKGWFTGISELFLGTTLPKVLLLAGTDRLDTALTRGQMQGKFQLLLMYGSGHVIQEDCPDKTADALLEFCGRLVPMTGLRTQKDILAEKLAKARNLMPRGHT
ncbi:protein phosphatase methylesterase [Achlya hypogyna]|uniref:Protein phosphatase methylesterase 1 n=1 Tax=Achlya hypogyna TaxID=1202772 RepID=A0A1V9Z0J3_ACHHY|nr:protein phosphatase methylesterase [Achlya hypogyna]